MNTEHNNDTFTQLILTKIEERVTSSENKILAALRPMNRRLRDAENRATILCPNSNAVADVQDRALSIGRLLKPHRAKNISKARFGSKHDGGYVQLEHFEGVGAALSLGIGDDVSWDLAVAARGLTVWQFDHTVEGPPIAHNNFRFEKLRIGSESRDGEISLEDAINRASADCDRIVLKMDIEGGEWAALANTPSDVLGKCNQIICELHSFDNLTDPNHYEIVHKCLERLNERFAVVHVHSNNFGSIIVLGNVPFFQTLEVCFANRRDYSLEATDELFPTPLDTPNNPNVPDHYLGSFNFGSSA
jgi:hypothetical protein